MLCICILPNRLSILHRNGGALKNQLKFYDICFSSLRVCSEGFGSCVLGLAVALHLMVQNASFRNVLGLFMSHASGIHKHCSDNVVIFWIVAP